jgi:hypothetical protein
VIVIVRCCFVIGRRRLVIVIGRPLSYLSLTFVARVRTIGGVE